MTLYIKWIPKRWTRCESSRASARKSSKLPRKLANIDSIESSLPAFVCQGTQLWRSFVAFCLLKKAVVKFMI